jgi:Protein-L-isoaspartate(D-aspartate) O-methyltransferase (PCMT)
MGSERLGSADTFGGYRTRLVEQLREQGIRDLAVLRAFAETPRHLFVPDAVRHRAYENTALPIGAGQTISQPFTQARYLETLHLQGGERVLEIGTGSGYQTALLSRLVAQVFTVERVQALAERAQGALRAAEARNVSVLLGDGTLGWVGALSRDPGDRGGADRAGAAGGAAGSGWTPPHPGGGEGPSDTDARRARGGRCADDRPGRRVVRPTSRGAWIRWLSASSAGS